MERQMASDDHEFRMRLPSRMLGPHRNQPLMYRSVFVIACVGQEDPAWAKMTDALDLVLAADAGHFGEDVTYWGEVETPSALKDDSEITDWLRRHPEAWSQEAYIGYSAGQRSAAAQFDARDGRLRATLADKLIELANAVHSPTEDETEPFEDTYRRPAQPDDSIPF
jgi:hypothetical protein